MNHRNNPPAFRRRCLIRLIICFGIAAATIWPGRIPAAAAAGLTRSTGITIYDHGQPMVWISAPTALRQVKIQPATVLVDFRNPREFGQVGIPGALNIPLHFIKTRQRLKNRLLILVGRGYGYRLPLKTCRHLQALGFKARLLFGGLSAWRSSGGLVEGDLTALARYENIPPRDFAIDLADGWVVPIGIGEKNTDKDPDLIPGVRYVAVGKKSKAGVKQFKEIVTDIKKASSYKTPVIVDMAARNTGDLKALLGKSGIQQLRFLKGGLTAYRQYLNGLARAGKPREARTQTVGGCLPCAKSSNSRQPVIKE